MPNMVIETPKISLDPDENLATVLVMAEELRSLLMNNAVFHTVTIEIPSGEKKILMSCGGLLARLHRLHQQREQFTGGQQYLLENAQKQTDETVRELRGLFYNVLQREAKVRLNDFRWFLDEG